jgi:hypothetical protein
MPKMNPEAKKEFDEWKKDNPDKNWLDFAMMKANEIIITKSFNCIDWKKKKRRMWSEQKETCPICKGDGYINKKVKK